MNQPSKNIRPHANVTGILAAIVGAALFVYFVDRAGINAIIAGASRIGWAFLIILGLAGLRFVTRALAWKRCITETNKLDTRNVLAAFLAGDALGNLLPLSVVVGEPVKALYLQDRIPLKFTLPALAVETLFYALSVVVIVIAGGLALFLLVQPPATEILVTAAPLLTLVLFVAGFHWIIWKRIPIVSSALHWLTRLHVGTAFLTRLSARAQNVEERIHRDYPRKWSDVLAIASLHALFHLLAIAEIFLMLSLISDHPPTIFDAFVLEAGNRFISVVFKFVPMRIGIDEAGTALLATLLSFSTATGITMALVRKGRLLCWSAIGIAALIRRGLSLAELYSRVEKQDV